MADLVYMDNLVDATNLIVFDTANLVVFVMDGNHNIV